MSQLKELLDQEAYRIDADPDALESTLRRRDRTLRNRRITAGVVGVAVFVAAVLVVTSVGSLDSSDSSVDPAAEGTGPVESVQIGTVTRSGAECVLEIDAEPIPSGPGRLTVVNNTNQVTAFDLFYLDPDLLTFSAFEEFVAAGKSGQPGAFVLTGREVGPGASGTIVDNFTSGDTFAVMCASLDPGPPPNVPAARIPFALVGPIVVPGGAGTGPTETGPTATESAGPPDAGWDGTGLPPEGAAPSTPEEGRLVAHHDAMPQSPSFAYVYADGRVLTYSGVADRSTETINERRLTPEGVELVRSGAIQAERFVWSSYSVPTDAWEEPEIKPYVPSRYAVCYFMGSGDANPGDINEGYEYPSTVVDFFPAPARAILEGHDHAYERSGDVLSRGPVECSEITTAEARALAAILSEVRVEDSEGDEIGWEFHVVLPHGEWVEYW